MLWLQCGFRTIEDFIAFFQVKVVAKRVVGQRSAMENYFLDALDKVRTEVALGR